MCEDELVYRTCHKYEADDDWFDCGNYNCGDCPYYYYDDNDLEEW